MPELVIKSGHTWSDTHIVTEVLNLLINLTPEPVSLLQWGTQASPEGSLPGPPQNQPGFVKNCLSLHVHFT